MSKSTSLEDVIKAALIALAETPEEAQTAKARARAIARKAAELGFSGTEYYIPSLSYMMLQERNEGIRQEFNGRNLHELMKRYAVGRSTVYRVARSKQKRKP